MAYTAGNRDHRTPNPVGYSGDGSPLPQNLFVAVAVLGLACYGLSFGPVVDGGGATGWCVRFATLAGLSAAFGLMSRTHPLPSVTAMLAAMGFLDALSFQLLSPEPGWALTVIVMLTAVQAAVAIAALVLSRKAEADNNALTGYEAYAEYYNQAVRNYYSQQAASPPLESLHRSGEGQAASTAQTNHAVQRTQRASQLAEYAEFVSAQGDYGHAAESTAEAGPPTPRGALPRFGQTQPPAPGRQETTAEPSVWPPSS